MKEAGLLWLAQLLHIYPINRISTPMYKFFFIPRSS
jgi:hypothetical protein